MRYHFGNFDKTMETFFAMKRIHLILLLQLILLASGYSQVIPKGMNYQAVARNIKGEIIPNQKISLKIYIFSNEVSRRTNHYSEIHEVLTNGLGLFNLIIGEGAKEQGEYGLIPWSSENVWMEVAIQDKRQSGFATISSSKLMAVPYAIHAGIAGRLTEKKPTQTAGSILPDPGVVSNFWSVFGNAKTNESGNPYHVNSLGTTDNVDLILISDNVERARVLKGGDIVTKLNFEVGQNLKIGEKLNVPLNATIGDSLIAQKDVLFNTIGGSTINNGPFTVAKMSQTLLSGKLTVDSTTDLNSTLTVDGPVDLNDSLSVNNLSPTKFTGTLQVDSTTNLNDALNVNTMSPTILSGTLLVDSCASFADAVKVLSTYSTDTSGLVPTGAVQVGGGAYIRENFYVGGVAKFGGPVAFAGAVSITDGTQSTSPSTGALKVSGGVGIGLNLNVGGAAMIGGMVTVKDLTESIDSTTGAFKVFGGVGIKKRLNVRGNVSIAGTLRVLQRASLNDLLNVTSSESFVANFRNTGNNNGISIQVNDPAPGHDNNFVEFRNNGGAVVGRIEGENISEYKLNETYIWAIDKLQSSILAASVAEVLSLIKVGVSTAELIAAATSATFCAGFGLMVCAPVPSLIVKAALDIIGAAVLAAANVIAIIDAATRYQDFKNYADTHYGVTYESAAGDYAEWLPKANPSETLIAGHIVGLKNGRISKNVEGAIKLMVISTQPIVLGNMPGANKELPYEKVAFLGQVPVHVVGKVNIGDYILPSGDNDGLGRAVSPDQMQVEDYSRIVGVAWTASESKKYRPTNVAIGLNGNDISKIVIEQKNKMQDLLVKLNKRNEILKKLVPGFKEEVSQKEMASLNAFNIPENKVVNKEAPSGASNQIDWSALKLTKEQVEDFFERAEKTVVKSGVDINTNSFWKRLKTDPSYKELLIEEVRRKVNAKLDESVKSGGND